MTWWLGSVAAAITWILWARYRNGALRRPPVVDGEGRPLPAARIRFSDGVETSGVDFGTGPPMVMIPGADGMKETFRHQLVPLAESYRILSADLRDSIPDDATFDRLVSDVVEFMDSRGVDRAVMVGQSLGGAIAMRVAARHPDRVRALVVANSLARVSYDHVGLNRTLFVPVAMATIRYLPTALARLFARLWGRLNVWVFDESDGIERLTDYALYTGPRTVRPRDSGARVDLLKREDLRPELASISAPTLVLKGSLDAYTPFEWSREIAAAIPGAKLAEIAGTGHCSHISKPSVFNRMLADWLDSIDTRS